MSHSARPFIHIFLISLEIFRPSNAQELFNLKHSSLRNVIERIFGVLKKRFLILNQMADHGYSCQFQVSLVPVVMALHNFIRKHDHGDELFKENDALVTQPVELNSADGNRGEIASEFRDSLAFKLWRQHQNYTREA